MPVHAFGTWNALAWHLKTDTEGNCAVADFIHVDAARNIIFDARAKNKTPSYVREVDSQSTCKMSKNVIRFYAFRFILSNRAIQC